MTTNERIQELINLVHRYDCYIEYIDDYRQYKQAERANGNIEARFIEVCSELGLEVTSSDFHNVLWKSHYDTIEEAVNKLLQDKGFNKEENNMTTNTTPANNTNKEATAMTRTERMMNMMDTINNVTKTTDKRYVTKEALATFLFDADIIQRHLSKTELKKIKRQELVDILSTAVNNLIKAGVIKPMKTVTIEEVDEALTIRKQKSDLCFHLIKTHALDNQKKGYGHTVSAYMLCAYILQAGYGMQKLKGHENEVTDEMKQTVKDIRNWMLQKNFIKPVTYKAQDGKVYYTSEYDGADGHKQRMTPVNADMGEVQVSTYKVNW